MTADYSQDLRDLIGRDAVDPDGDKIGKIDDVYVDEDSGEPSWLAVKTGWFGSHISFVPIEGVYFGGDDAVVSYQKDTVKDAPHFDADGHLGRDEEARLYEHYNVRRRGGTTDTTDTTTTTTGGRDVTNTDVQREQRGSDDAMTRSEEELEVNKRQTETGRARVRKWIETEHVQMTVPIRREKARLVTEPVDSSNRDEALSGADLTESEHEVVLSEEEVDVNKRVVPKERVRLEKEVETEEVPVDESVRKERIEMDRDDTR